MTIEYTAFAIGAFFIAVVLIRKKLRFIDARLREMRTELNELRAVETRLFMMALNASPKREESRAEPRSEVADTNGGEVVSKNPEHTPSRPDREHELGSELIGLVPASEQDGGKPATRFDGRRPVRAWPPQK
jgi:hypothetical protein